MAHATLDELTRPLAIHLMEGHMDRFGIAPTMRLAEAYHRLHGQQGDEARRAMYRHDFADLLRENGPVMAPDIRIRDGWALDQSRSLPYLDPLLDAAAQIIARRGGVRRKEQGAYRSFFQNIITDADLADFPAILNFALSSDVLRVVGDHLQSIPILSATIPEGIRFMESSAEFDDIQSGPHDSQLFHIDYYARPMVYVLVCLHNVVLDHGPWCWFSAAISAEAARRLNYWAPGRPYRLSDEEVYGVVPRSELMELTCPRGTVLFIEPTSCFHYGSRASIIPRYMLMLGYTTAIRTDFSELTMKPRLYTVRADDSPLRKMVLRKEGITLPRE